MTFKDLAAWVKTTQKLDEQVIIALQEDVEPDESLEEVGQVCFLPFVAHTTLKHSHEIRGEMWPKEDISHIHIELWKNEEKRIPQQFYTWQNLLDWVDTLKDCSIDANALVAWHLCQLKFLKNNMLYIFKEEELDKSMCSNGDKATSMG